MPMEAKFSGNFRVVFLSDRQQQNSGHNAFRVTTTLGKIGSSLSHQSGSVRQAPGPPGPAAGGGITDADSL